MLAALLLGLSGSAGHCAAMCGGIGVLLARDQRHRFVRLAFIHLGRILSYGMLGLLAGSTGQLVHVMSQEHGHMHEMSASGPLPAYVVGLQGVLALLSAAFALYFALALLGRVPSPELLLHSLTRRWGVAMRKWTGGNVLQRTPWLGLPIGMLWGLLPCGLVLAALLLAVASGNALGGFSTMIVFGMGTLPVHLALVLAGRSTRPVWRWSGLRYVAAGVVAVFGLQMALRGMAVWGVVGHQQVGGFMLW